MYYGKCAGLLGVHHRFASWWMELLLFMLLLLHHVDDGMAQTKWIYCRFVDDAHVTIFTAHSLHNSIFTCNVANVCIEHSFLFISFLMSFLFYIIQFARIVSDRMRIVLVFIDAHILSSDLYFWTFSPFLDNSSLNSSINLQIHGSFFYCHQSFIEVICNCLRGHLTHWAFGKNEICISIDGFHNFGIKFFNLGRFNYILPVFNQFTIVQPKKCKANISYLYIFGIHLIIHHKKGNILISIQKLHPPETNWIHIVCKFQKSSKVKLNLPKKINLLLGKVINMAIDAWHHRIIKWSQTIEIPERLENNCRV